MKRTFPLFAAALALLLTGCCNKPAEPVVKNVIYIIGDGMGHAAISLVVNEDGVSNMERATAVGMSKTRSLNAEITDSAAGGTALSTGFRTNNTMIAQSPDGDTLVSIMTKAQAMGKSAGIVVCCSFVDATPAVFFAHSDSRYKGMEFGPQFVDSGVDVLFGGGMRIFNNRPDSLNYVPALEEKGYFVTGDWEEGLASDSKKIVCLPHHIGYIDNRPEGYLPKSTQKALDVLSQNEDGFFLMIESSYIDGYGHSNKQEFFRDEVADLDATLGVAMDFADSHPGTLVVVTADHETGGAALTHDGIMFSTKGHSAAVVPVFAYGTGAEKFSRVFDNFEIPQVIESMMK